LRERCDRKKRGKTDGGERKKIGWAEISLEKRRNVRKKKGILHLSRKKKGDGGWFLRKGKKRGESTEEKKCGARNRDKSKTRKRNAFRRGGWKGEKKYQGRVNDQGGLELLGML